MATNIKINIVEPGTPPSPTPVDPGIDPAVPNTGLFTHGIGGPEATIIIVSIVAVLAIAAAAILYYRKKHSKNSKTNKFADAINVVKAKKKVSIPLAALALVVSLGTLTALLVNAGKSNTNAVEGDTENSLTVTESSEDLTIEVGDTPVFAVLPVELTVEEATAAGYTLTAFTEDTNLVSTTDNTNIIPMVAADEGELVALADNTYGLSLVKPESQDDESFTALSTDVDMPTFITDKDYEETKENDKTTIYYGFYITPDTPYGTYEGSEINYAATANRADLATVTFDGNGLNFAGNKKTNIVRYEWGATSATELKSHTLNVDNAGKQSGMYPIDTAETFVYDFADASKVNVEIVKSGNDSCSHAGGFDTDAYFSFWSGSHPDYTAETKYPEGIKAFGNTTGKYIFGDYNNVQTDIENTSTVTMAYHVGSGGSSRGCGSGYGYYAIITATDADGNPAYAMGNAQYSGAYQTPATTEYDNYKFLGWSLDPNATSADYADAADIETNMILNAGEKVTLYAVWSPVVNLSYDGNNATAGSMESTSYSGDTPTTVTLAHEDIIAGDNIDLYAPNYKKTGYGFAGWSTDQNAWEDLTDDDESNEPVIYGPNQSFTMTKDIAIETAEGKDTLYAVWVPAEQNNGTPVSLQDWQGCSTLTPATYSAETGTITIGKNTITALTDNRDGEVYTVARLADGNCWMTENLRLDNNATISTTNTNNPLTVDGNVAIKNNDGNNHNHLSPNSRSWCTNYDSAACYDQSYLNTFNTNLGGEGAIASYNGNNNDENKAFQWQSYGNNYNWYSATAGNGVRETTSTVAGDICPAGWMLPIGKETTTNGSFSHLDTSMGGTGSYQNSTEASNRWRSFPNNFVYSGYWYGSSASSRGSSGSYWSSTAYDTSHAHGLGFYSGGGVGPGTNYYNKHNGLSVRCVAPVE